MKLTKAKEKKRKAKDDVKRKREGNEQYNLRENAPANKLLRRESSQNSFKLRERERGKRIGLECSLNALRKVTVILLLFTPSYKQKRIYKKLKNVRILTEEHLKKIIIIKFSGKMQNANDLGDLFVVFEMREERRFSCVKRRRLCREMSHIERRRFVFVDF